MGASRLRIMGIICGERATFHRSEEENVAGAEGGGSTKMPLLLRSPAAAEAAVSTTKLISFSHLHLHERGVAK